MMKKSEKNTARKRESILKAAYRAFSDDGYDNTSMDSIADMAGASKRTVYNHYRNKEELFRAVTALFAGEMHALKQIHYESTRSLEEQLSDFAESELTMAQDPIRLNFIKTLVSAFHHNPDLAADIMSRYRNDEDTLAVWLRKADEDGRLTVENPRIAASVFWSMLSGAFTWPAVYQGGLDADFVTTMKKELIETFLCRFRR